MIDLILESYRRKVEEIKTERLRAKAERNILEATSELVVDRPDSDGWVRRAQVNDWEKGHLQQNQLEVVRKTRENDRWNPHTHGILNTLRNYIMGKGLSIAPKSDDLMVLYVWREFSTAERNKWTLKQFEIVRRTFRDGEVFLHVMDKDENNAPTGKTTIRFIDPLLVRHSSDETVKDKDDPSESIKNGVVTDPDDIENVIEYQVMDRVSRTKWYTIPADEMIHIKINADSDEKRGEPEVQTLLKYFRNYEQWLENRIILNKMRTAIVLIKKVEGTPTEVANMAATLPLARRNVANELKRQNFRGGTIITAGPGVDYKMESPNINASDVKEDGRNIILAMAAGTNIPEYLFGDASNANYASTMIAESPFVKAIQFWQVFFEYHFQRLFRKVVENAVTAGLVEAPDDNELINQIKKIRTLGEQANDGENDDADLSPKEAAIKEIMPNGRMEIPSEVFFGADITWPEIVHRDIKEQTEALSLMRQNGWIADLTASSSLGYEYAEEVRKQRKIEEDAEIEDNPLLSAGGNGDAGDMAGEMNSVLSQLTPEERQTIMNSTDPKEVQAIMAKYQGASAPDGTGGNIPGTQFDRPTGKE